MCEEKSVLVVGGVVTLMYKYTAPFLVPSLKRELPSEVLISVGSVQMLEEVCDCCKYPIPAGSGEIWGGRKRREQHKAKRRLN